MSGNQQEAGFEFLCNAIDCKHSDSCGGCSLHTMRAPIIIKEGGLCEKYEKK